MQTPNRKTQIQNNTITVQTTNTSVHWEGTRLFLQEEIQWVVMLKEHGGSRGFWVRVKTQLSAFQKKSSIQELASDGWGENTSGKDNVLAEQWWLDQFLNTAREWEEDCLSEKQVHGRVGARSRNQRKPAAVVSASASVSQCTPVLSHGVSVVSACESACVRAGVVSVPGLQRLCPKSLTHNYIVHIIVSLPFCSGAQMLSDFFLYTL